MRRFTIFIAAALGCEPSPDGWASSYAIHAKVPPGSAVVFLATTEFNTELVYEVLPPGLRVLEGGTEPTSEGLARLSDIDWDHETVVDGVGTILSFDSDHGWFVTVLQPGERADRATGDAARPLYVSYLTVWNPQPEQTEVRVVAIASATTRPDPPSLEQIP